MAKLMQSRNGVIYTTLAAPGQPPSTVSVIRLDFNPVSGGN